MKSYLALTPKYLKKHIKRTILTICGIIVAIAMFTAVALIYYSLMNDTIDRVKKDVGDFEVGFVELNLEKLEVLRQNAELKDGGIISKIGQLEVADEALSDKPRSLDIKGYDEAALKKIFKPELVEGRLPKDSTELIVDVRFYHILKEKTDKKILSGQVDHEGEGVAKTYNIVGAYSTKAVISGMSYPAITYLDEISEAGNAYGYFATLKDKKHKSEMAQKVAEDTGTEVMFNKELLYLYRQGPDRNKNRQFEIMIITIIVIIVLSTIVVIYNAFNASIVERIKHFGILRAVGATKGQIRQLVLKEAFMMSLIALPLGIFSGYAGIYITFQIVEGFSEWFKLGLYPEVMMISALLGIGTVFLAVFVPAVSASKVAPIEAIRGNGVIKKEKIKRRKGLLTKFIFKFEGQVAYRNMRRNGKRFWFTTFSLVISLILFIFFNVFINLVIQSANMMYANAEIEGCYQIKDNKLEETLDADFVSTLQKIEGVSKTYLSNVYEGPLLIEEDKLNKDYYNDLVDWAKNKTVLYRNMYISKAMLMAYDKNAFETSTKKNKLNISYSDFEENGVILINKADNLNQKGQGILGDFTTYQVGDEIKLPKMSEAYYKTEDIKYAKAVVDQRHYLTFKVVAIIDKETLLDDNLNTFGVVLSHKNYGKVTGALGYNFVGMTYTSEEASEKFYETLNTLGSEKGAEFFDVYKYMKQSKSILMQIITLGYGFIALITLIAVINIINTITMNLLIKKREFAVFKAIGMTKGQFQKLVLLEGTLYGILASMIGNIVAYLIITLILKGNNPVAAYGIDLPVWPYLAGTIGIIGITFAAALLPLRKLNDMNIIDGLRIEE